jgi:hypothetical protein
MQLSGTGDVTLYEGPATACNRGFIDHGVLRVVSTSMVTATGDAAAVAAAPGQPARDIATRPRAATI